MTDDELGREFDELIEHMSNPDNAQEVEITEIAEQASIVQVSVPITAFALPEIVLLRTVTEYLASMPRRAILGVTITYEIRSHNLPFLIGTFMLGEPVNPPTENP